MGLVRAVESIRMPTYRGDAATGKHIVSVSWRVDGMLPDGRVFTVAVETGFAFDGCSIPRALWRVCGHPMEVPRVAAALAHDWLYAAHVCDRKTADAIYAAICREVGMGASRTWIEHKALRMCGDAAWKSHGAEDQEFARAHGTLVINGKIQGEKK